MQKIKEKYKQFRQWQKTPFVVAPLSPEKHICLTCNNEYTGNYCPRCSQSAQTDRFSFKKMFLSFLDVWGFGNRSMFRTIRDLIFRPGYMIRDYLLGMRMAYFPPFKMFFILITISVLVSHGLNIKGQNYNTNIVDINTNEKHELDKYEELNVNILQYFSKIENTNPAIVSLVFITMFSWIFFLYFRKSKHIGKMGFAEFFIAMVYTNNMTSVYSIVKTFFCINNPIVELCILVSYIFPLKQISGYNWKKTILRFALSAISIILFFSFVIFSIEIVALLTYKS